MTLYDKLQSFLRKFFKVFFSVELVNWDSIPKGRDTLVCANHVSNWDPLFISAYYPERVHWMAKKELFRWKWLKNLLEKLGAFPVDREGNDIGALRHALRFLKNNETLGIFPEGTRVRNGKVSEPKSGVGLIAVKTKTVVVPIHIEGSYRPFSKIRLTVKEPMDYKEVVTKDYEETTRKIMERIYEG